MTMSVTDANAAGETWGFNCGPAALCAVLDITPEEIRPHLREFEQKRYTNPSLMSAILRDLRVPYRRIYECLGAAEGPQEVEPPYPHFGLVRIQWGGPWTKEGVPVRVRYRHTHWIAVRGQSVLEREAFDVNAVCVGGWLSWAEWTSQLVPWLLKECELKGDGRWWPTHCWEVLSSAALATASRECVQRP